MDQMVLATQQWLNATYTGKYGYNPVPEDGKTSWTTMYGLTRALQIELGIASPADNFGPTTSRYYNSWGPISMGNVPATQEGTNIVTILQGGCWCKGYNPGGLDGVFGSTLDAAVRQLTADANLPVQDGVVYDYVFKAFLTMDAYVLVSGGDPNIRTIQRNLNNLYYKTSGVQPCDGIYQSQTNKALIYGIQTEEGIAAGSQTGSVGPTTKSLLPTLNTGASGNFVKLLQYALYFNNSNLSVFDGVYSSATKSAIQSFQSFMVINETGVCDQQTWLSLLQSCGDTSRSASACDCATILTPDKAATLYSNGYRYVGRYLTGTVGGVSKALTASEIQTIFAAGLKFFPIYETNGTYDAYFTSNQGKLDAQYALAAAENLGIPAGTTIYFAVDYDAMDYEVTSYVLPYFSGVYGFASNYQGGKYKIGVYGARNICTRVSDAGYAHLSFVGDMSTGFSGNIGFPMPLNWAFDQFTTVSAGSGSGAIEIDKDAYSGRDPGVSFVNKTANIPVVSIKPPYNPDSATVADPVDTSTGAHMIDMLTAKVKGAIELDFKAKYNSGQLATGSMGIGWYHNFEMSIKADYSSYNVYWNPSEYSVFTQNASGTYTCTDLGKQNDLLTVNADGSFLLNRNNDFLYSFTSQGVLTNVQNRVGQNISLTSDADGNLVITEVISGMSLKVSYNDAGLVGSVTDGENKAANFEYDSNNCLVKITDANQNPTTFTYDSMGRILTGTDGDHFCFFTNKYDDKGRVISQQDGNTAVNQLTTFAYDDSSVSGQIIVTITDRNAKVSKNVFDANTLQLLSTTDANKLTTSYTYDANGNLKTETDNAGNSIQYEFDGQNHMTKMTDRENAVTAMTYDSMGNLLTITNPDSGKIIYTYDTSNRVKTMTDLRNTVTTYTYEDNGLLKTKQMKDQEYQYAYNGGLLQTITDPNGSITAYTYDKTGRVLTILDAEQGLTAFTYDGAGNVLTKKDALSNINSFTYNSRGKVLTQTDNNQNVTAFAYDGNLNLISKEDAKHNVTTYVYDGEDRLIETDAPMSKKTYTTYDDGGRILTQKDADGNVTTYTYDNVNNIASIKKPNQNTTTYTYFKNGKLKTETDAAQNTITYGYDDGWRQSVVTNPLNKPTTKVFNAAGDLLSVTDPLNNKTVYTYDDYGNVLTITDPNQNVTAFTYDNCNNRLTKKDALQNVTAYQYDKMNRLTQVTDANNHTAVTAYDALGRVISKTDALQNKSTFVYDPNGNLTEQYDAYNKKIQATAYDKLNLPETVQDAYQNQVTNTYDELGRLVSLEDPLSNVTTYEYDPNGHLTAVTDPLQGKSSIEYDPNGNQISLQNPLGGVIHYTFDNLDLKRTETTVSNGKINLDYNTIKLLSKYTNARGQVRSYNYDDAGRLLNFTDPEGTTAFTYDSNGNVLTVSDAAGTVTREYDELNRVKTYTDVNNKVVRYEYDKAGNLTKVTYPDGVKTVTYEYDEANRLKTVTDWAGRVTTYTYDNNGRVIETDRPDGSILKNEYDDAGRMTLLSDKDALGNIICEYTFAYDEKGEMKTETSTAASLTAAMTYDGLGRLTDRTLTDSSSNVVENDQYTFDADGNILSANSPEQNIAMTYDNLDRVSTFGGKSISIDPDGNMINAFHNGNSSQLSFDSANRLTSVDETTYVYDANDTRVSATVQNSTTTFVYDIVSDELSRLLVSTDNLGNATYFVYGHGLIGHEDDAGYTTYHFDYRGSTAALTNSEGVVTDTYTYGAYGELASHVGSSLTPFNYNGRDGVMTESNGLYYMRARYYSPEFKRFVNADLNKGAIDELQTINVYAFVTGNPIMLVDPTGFSSEPGVHDSNWLESLLKGFDKGVSYWSPPPLSGNYGILSGSTGFKFLNAGVSEGKNAQLFEDAELRPGIGLNASANATLLQANISGAVGSSKNKVSVSENGSYMTASAKLGVNVGYNPDEDFQANASAKAFAAVVQGSVSGGITIFGVTINGTIGGSAGSIGIEGNIGYSSKTGGKHSAKLNGKEHNFKLNEMLAAVVGEKLGVEISW